MSLRVVNGKTFITGYFEDVKKVEKNESCTESQSFKDILQSKLNVKNSFSISNHAAQRINSMNLTEQDMINLGEGIEKAEQKGSKNSLIMYKDIAFVTSIENKTVITAVENARSKENIFTNIDSVLFL